MLDDRSAIEHHKYSQRLTELERRSAAAQQRFAGLRLSVMFLTASES